MAAPAKTIVIEIQMEEGDPLGATPNDKLVIVKVQPGTLADGQLRVGDQIVKVNGTKVQDSDHFYKLLRFAHPVARLDVVRDDAKAAELEAKFTIPEERAKFIQRRDGYVYQLAKIEWRPGGPKLGLGIKHYQNRVLVSRCEPGSLAAQQLQVGDHICDVEGTPVTDKDVARDLLLKAIQKGAAVSFVIERPESMEAKHWTQTALSASAAQPPSVAMNSDVRDIAAKERANLKNRAAQKPPKPIISRGAAPCARHVNINENHREHPIISDHDMSKLRRVRK
ncbi:PDZ domain containing protein [Aphelenchoides avenae]|nr:PDZ domain containing protein [Aphelenchus avenae]